MGLLGWIDRKIIEAQTCPGCGCNADRWRDNCDCLRQGCSCAGAEEDDNPGWEREPGPDAAIVDASSAAAELPPAATAYVPVLKSDPEAAQLAQARNRATFLRRTAVTDRERQEAQEARDAYIDRLSTAVDRAFAERDRLWAARGHDDPAAGRQEDHAVRLLDQYNAEVQADTAEVQRRREENLRRYREQHEDEWTRGRDAAGGADLPPAAEPYGPPRSSTDSHVRTKWRVHRVRWLGPLPDDTQEPRPPQTTDTPTSPSGGDMSNIESAQASIRGAHDVGQQVLAGLAQQHASLEEVQNALRHATQGSHQAEAEQANAQLAEAMDKIDEARAQVAAALAEFEGVAARL